MKHHTAPRKQVAGSSSRKQATGPELRRLLKAIRQAGGEVEQCKRRNHWKVYYNDQVIGVLSCSPSDWRGYRNEIARLRRAGLPLTRQGTCAR